MSDDAKKGEALAPAPAKRVIPQKVLEYLQKHQMAATPDEQTVTGIAGIKLTLADIKALVKG